MATTIPKMDQEIINEYFPDQVVLAIRRSVGSVVRAYIFNSGKALFISTSKGKADLTSALLNIQGKRKCEFEMKSKGSHLICILQS